MSTFHIMWIVCGLLGGIMLCIHSNKSTVLDYILGSIIGIIFGYTMFIVGIMVLVATNGNLYYTKRIRRGIK